MDNAKIENWDAYDNTKAFNELLKMMKRHDLITVSFLLDKEGYESVKLESKKIDRFILRMNNELFRWIFRYLEFGEIKEPLPSPTENLIRSEDSDSDSFASDILKRLLIKGMDSQYLHLVPEIADKPNRLSVVFRYKYGCIVFRVQRTEEMETLLTSLGL